MLRRRRRADRGRVEGVGGDRRQAALGARGGGGLEAAAGELVIGRKPGGELVLGLVERQPIATQSVGSPTASTMSWPIPGSIWAAASRIEPPENRISSRATRATAPTASRAL